MELYVNGERIVATGNSWKENHRVELSKEQLEEWNYTLKVAAHCKWFSDARYIDFGIYHNDNSEKIVGRSAKQVSVSLGDPEDLRERFIRKGNVRSREGEYMAISSDLGKVGAKVVSDYIMVGYDDIYSIRYYDQNVRPYWNRNGDSSIRDQFVLAADQYESVMRHCEEFDGALMKEAHAAGGKEYAYHD